MEQEKTNWVVYRSGDKVPYTGEYLVVDTEADRLVLRSGETFPEGKAGSCYLPLSEGCLPGSCDVSIVKQP